MDPRLSKAARLGDVVALNALLQEDPLILERVCLGPIVETPLHIAALSGKTDFVKELLRNKPSFARELSRDGFSPLHIASALGHLEIVRELLEVVDQDVCSLRDNQGRTALHHASIRGRIDVIEELVSVTDSKYCNGQVLLRDVTPEKETALHLAVINRQFEALRVLIKMLSTVSGGGSADDQIHAKDARGLTILQLAMATKQLQVVEYLQRSQTEVRNDEMQGQIRGKTDVLSQASASANMDTRVDDSMVLHPKAKDVLEWSNNGNEQSAILVAACLIATVSYQAGLTPPPTVWKESMKLDLSCIIHPFRNNADHQNLPDSTACPTVTFYSFMSFNTAGFLCSILLIFLHKNKPLAQFLLGVSFLAMVMTYLTVLVAISPSGTNFLITFIVVITIVGYCTMAYKLSRKLVNKLVSICKQQKLTTQYTSSADA